MRNCGFTHRLNKQPAYDDMAMDNFLEEISDKCSIDQLFLSSVEEISPIIELIMTISGSTDERCFYLSLLTRLITSALIDADRSDTYSFMNNEEHKEGRTLTPGILEALTENFNSRLSELECVIRFKPPKRAFRPVLSGGIKFRGRFQVESSYGCGQDGSRV